MAELKVATSELFRAAVEPGTGLTLQLLLSDQFASVVDPPFHVAELAFTAECNETVSKTDADKIRLARTLFGLVLLFFIIIFRSLKIGSTSAACDNTTTSVGMQYYRFNGQFSAN
jgi:hypothetical protein